MMNKKLVLTRKTFRLVMAYNRLPHEGRTILDQLVRYLAAIDKVAFPKTEILGKPQA
jgi:hypothetical protein